MSTFQSKQGLDGVCAKLARAHQHLEEFQATSDAWVDSRPYAVRREFDPESGWIRFVWVIFRPPPDQFGVILGDFLNNLRAVLDHLVGALVKRFGNPVSWGHAFPILTAEKDWPNDPNWPKLAGIPLGWQAVNQVLAALPPKG